VCYITRARKHDREGRYDENGEKRERKRSCSKECGSMAWLLVRI
jgi:hypothetical protein